MKKSEIISSHILRSIFCGFVSPQKETKIWKVKPIIFMLNKICRQMMNRQSRTIDSWRLLSSEICKFAFSVRCAWGRRGREQRLMISRYCYIAITDIETILLTRLSPRERKSLFLSLSLYFPPEWFTIHLSLSLSFFFLVLASFISFLRTIVFTRGYNTRSTNIVNSRVVTYTRMCAYSRCRRFA